MWNKDEIKGKGKQVVGKVKKSVGDLTNDPELEQEGRREEAEGNVQETVGKVRRKVGEAVDDVKKAVTGK